MTRHLGRRVRNIAAITGALACGISAGSALAAETPAAPTFAAEELEQIVAPIALYPDSLLAQVFMASTYPLEVVEAARFAEQNPELKDTALDDALKQKTWDASVKSLVSFPQVLTMMNEKLDWTQKLGDAFLAQQQDVMNAVQRLRAKAHEQGNLESTEQQTVTVKPAAPTNVTVEQAPTQVVVEQAPPQVIVIEQTNPQVVYVPAYNPVVVYGPWPYPAYPPYYYYPPGYVAGSAVWFGAGMAVGAAIWGDCDWDNGDIDIDINEHNEFNRNTNVDRGDRGEGGRGEGDRTDRGRENQRRDSKQASDRGRGGDRGGRQSWSHDPSHRKGVQYRDQASQQRYDRGGPKGADAREAYRGRAEQGRQQIAREGASQVQRDVDRANAGSARDRAGSTARDRSGQPQRSASGPSGSARDRSSSGQRAGSMDRSRGSDAFRGVGHGSQVRRDSSRGHSSRMSSRGGGGGGRGGGGRRR